MNARRFYLLQLIPPKPACFDTTPQWREYVMTAADASHEDTYNLRPFKRGPRDGDAPNAWNPEFNYCLDCSKEYHDQMARQGRCAKALADKRGTAPISFRRRAPTPLVAA